MYYNKIARYNYVNTKIKSYIIKLNTEQQLQTYPCGILLITYDKNLIK